MHENEVENGKKLVQILIDKKCRNIGLIGWEQGDATWLGRWEGYKAGVEEWNAAHPSDQVKLSDPQYAGTSSEGGAKAAEALKAMVRVAGKPRLSEDGMMRGGVIVRHLVLVKLVIW